MKILNIHGYKGTPYNAAYSALCIISDDIVSPALDYDAETPGAVLQRLLDLCAEEAPDMLVGTSLGGFFAAVIASKIKKPLLLVNPCLNPQSVLPALGYEGGVGVFDTMSAALSELDTKRVRCIIGGRDEIIGDHSLTKRLIGKERVIVIADGMHSGATLGLERYFPQMVQSVCRE